MKDVIELELPSGKVVLAEVEPAPGLQPAGPATERLRRKLDDVVGLVREVADTIVKGLAGTREQAREMSLTVGVKFAGSGNIVLATGSGEASVTVTIRW